jgi:ribonuclease HI
LKKAAGQGSNNRAKFYALWLLLKTAKEKGLKQFQVYGDSKMLMYWANNKYQTGNLTLVPIMNQVMEVKNRFEEISFNHIYREYNTKADQLSKETLLMQEGILFEQEFRRGSQISIHERSLYLS